MKKIVLLFVVLGVTIWASVIETRLNYSIEVADDSPVAVAAGSELKAYLQRIYSKPIELNGSVEQIKFYVGAAGDGSNKLPNVETMPEHFGIFRDGRSIVFVGKDDAKPYAHIGENGTLLSVFYFLRKYAGLKVYAPDDEHGEVITANKPITITESDVPDFSFKVRGMGRSFPDYNMDHIQRYAKKQMFSIPYWAHSDVYYTCLNKWNKRFKERPELFGMYDGVRKNANYPLHIPCLGNPEVKQIIVNDILERMQKKPGRVLRVFCDAPFRRCECKLCNQECTPEDYFYGFIIDVYKEVRKSYPELRLFLQEKGGSHCNPPTSPERLDFVAVDLNAGYPSVVDYSKARPLYEAWAAKGALPMLRLYPRMPMWDSYPIINPHSISNCLGALRGVCWGQRDSDAAMLYSPRFNRKTPYAFVAMTNYIYANTLLDVDASTDELMMDFCNFMYPGAGPEMVAFYAYMEKMYNGANLHDDPLLTCYAYDKLAEPARLLDVAAKKCTDMYWMSKMQEAFAQFVSYSKLSHDENVQFAEYNADARMRCAAFAKAYPLDKPLHFTSEKMKLPLCPVNMLKAPFQESFAEVNVIDGKLNIVLSGQDAQPTLLKREAIPGKNGHVWADECFELMFTSGEKNTPYLQLILNPNGALQALYYEGIPRRSSKYAHATEINVTASVTEAGWNGTMSIPLEILESICHGKQGKFCIFRTNRHIPAPGDEHPYSAISAFTEKLPDGNYHNSDVYRTFQF